MGRRPRCLAFLALLTLGVSGCLVTSTSSSGLGYPAGPSLDQFDVRARCERGGDCSQRAMDALETALGRLGAEIRDTPITTTGDAPPPDRLYVNATSDPPLEWRSSSGAGGSAGGLIVDLTDANPYVVVAPQFAFRLSDEDAAAIRDALFVDR
jgi:hypothetical protein